MTRKGKLFKANRMIDDRLLVGWFNWWNVTFRKLKESVLQSVEHWSRAKSFQETRSILTDVNVKNNCETEKKNRLNYVVARRNFNNRTNLHSFRSGAFEMTQTIARWRVEEAGNRRFFFLGWKAITLDKFNYGSLRSILREWGKLRNILFQTRMHLLRQSWGKFQRFTGIYLTCVGIAWWPRGRRADSTASETERKGK